MILNLTIAGLLCLTATGFMVKYGWASSTESNKDETSDDISRIWGHYSPVFSVPSQIDPSLPNECEATFGLILSRHGARYPTAHKTEMYNATITRIQSSVTKYGKGYEWLKTYTYGLGADDLTEFGQGQLVDSGDAFYKRYQKLARKSKPFIRAAGSDRVIMSSYNFTQGFFISQGESWEDRIGDILIVSEEDGANNTMSHGNCAAFEDDGNSYPGDNASDVWRGHFIPSVTKRLNKNLPGAELTEAETIYLMDLCPFNTVNTPDAATRSKFCRLFTKEEWKGYDYLLSVDKFYGYGNGNPLGPTQGVGYVNELIARLTKKPVVDHTTANTTLDASPETFPLDRALYADFSHDNVMVSIFSAMGLYNETRKLPTNRILPAPEASGYSSAWVVPFGARMYVEKLSCAGTTGEYVRVLVNDRVIPLKMCGADIHGRCKLDDFVNSLAFARNGGFWDHLVCSSAYARARAHAHARAHGLTMVSTAGGIVIAIVVLLLAAVIGWIVFTQLRARRLGLPPPSLASYLPWHKEDNPYGPPRPAPGGIVGWFNDKIRKFKNRNNRSAAGAYEQDQGDGTRGRRGFGPLDPDEAWDTRVGPGADSYGYDEEELGGGRDGRGTEYGGASYRMNVATPPSSGARGLRGDDEEDRGRRASRSPGSGPGGRNPFDDDAAMSLRGVSPRPIDTDLPAKQKRHDDPDSAGSSPTERRSVFRENM
ncbi:histidine phosphatase superfamily [Dactylonectria macrodidyma]|uniref:Histidine phosphatase superfamily n=1 Tax=Dactylonectria macrodidyma TaxID=307937 RepID=A0A9P9E9G1_9HYPO|nr:histidine phosphatase superfamily [Dactylonectria macrodidyma]